VKSAGETPIASARRMSSAKVKSDFPANFRLSVEYGIPVSSEIDSFVRLELSMASVMVRAVQAIASADSEITRLLM